MRAARGSGTRTATSTSTSTWPSACSPPATRTRSSRRRCSDRVANGTCYTFPVEDSIPLAEEIKRRFGFDLVRFSNSGTEATMDAIRVARGFTGREKIIKFEGGYHGHHDDVLVSIQPPREPWGPPTRRPACRPPPGLPRSRLAETVVAPFNQPDTLAAILERHRGEIAAIIVEPVQFNIGVVPPLPGFLERVRELATEHGIVLIFDEVKTGVVIAYGGATEYFGVQPDLFCLAKSIGGGVPIGAFGGREEVMRSIEHGAGAPTPPARPVSSIRRSAAARPASRTWAPLTATRCRWLPALVTLTKVLTREVYPRLHAMADRLTAGCQEVLDEFGLPGYAINVGSEGLRHVHARPGDELPRLHRPRRRAVGGVASSTWPIAASCCRPDRTTSGPSPCSTATRRSSATSPSSATSRRRWLASRRWTVTRLV